MKFNKIILAIAGLLVLVGAVISGVAICLGAAMPENRTLQTQTADGSISTIHISINADDIRIVSADTDVITVTYYTGKTKQYDFHTEGGLLSLESVATDKLNLKWYDHINFDLNDKDNRITVELPRNLRADLIVDSRYGDIDLSDVTGSLQITAKCGDIDVNRCTFSTLVCDADYGDVDVEQTTAETIHITNNCGDIDVTDVSGNISVFCDYGDIDIEKITTNHINLENNCGDIECTILGSETDYTITAETRRGDQNIRNRTGGDNTLAAKTALGDISIKFLR